MLKVQQRTVKDTAKSNDVQSIETSVELPQNMTDGFQTENFIILAVKRNLINAMKLYNIVTER